MNPERHQLAMRILADALECDTGAREQWLAQTCAGDEQLRTDIQSLIEQRKQASGFLEESLFEMAEHRLESEQWLIGKQIGVYRITGVIGRGGMGAVYRAVRDDDEFHREVAIKIIRPGLDSALILRRFRNERQILANLDHQNIARLFDGGTTEQGIPYLVMEYVDGQPLHEFADSHKLSITDRLKLFLLVCEAVDYAHQHKVVHRDLKPGNILVTKEGIPKLLDFGIAKLVDSGPATITNDSTVAALRGMTPEYASPEQMRGQPITPSSDIYSLGVILFELLIGQRPYNLRHASPYEIAQVVCESEPEKPSSVIVRPQQSQAQKSPRTLESSTQIRRQMSGDLDTIVLTALRKEPERRYASVGQFGEDIKRHLEGRTIRARKDTISYRGLKFLKRNRAAVLTTLIVALLCAALAVSITLMTTAPRGTRSIAVLPFPNANQDSSQEYLSDGMTDNLISELSQIPDLKVATRSAVYRYKGRTSEASTIGNELAVETVLAGRMTSGGDQLAVEVSLINVRNGQVLWSSQYKRQPTETLILQREISRDVADALGLSAKPDNRKQRQTHDDEAYRLYLQGNYFWNRRTPQQLTIAADFYQQAITRDPNYALAYDGLAKSYALIGAYCYSPPDEVFPKAKTAALRSIELDPALAEAYTTLALVAWLYDWDWQAAEREFKKAIDLNPRYVTAHHWYGLYLGEMGRADESIAEMRRALELDPVSVPVLADLGRVYFFARRYDEALQQYQQVISMDPSFVALYWEVGYVYEQKGMLKEWLSNMEASHELSPERKRIYETRGLKALLRMQADQSAPGFPQSYYRAEKYARIGEKTKAFEQLERAYRERDHRMSQLKVNPVFDPLRSDPRFDELLRRMNLGS